MGSLIPPLMYAVSCYITPRRRPGGPERGSGAGSRASAPLPPRSDLISTRVRSATSCPVIVFLPTQCRSAPYTALDGRGEAALPIWRDAGEDAGKGLSPPRPVAVR